MICIPNPIPIPKLTADTVFCIQTDHATWNSLPTAQNTWHHLQYLSRHWPSLGNWQDDTELQELLHTNLKDKNSHL